MLSQWTELLVEDSAEGDELLAEGPQILQQGLERARLQTVTPAGPQIHDVIFVLADRLGRFFFDARLPAPLNSCGSGPDGDTQPGYARGRQNGDQTAG